MSSRMNAIGNVINAVGGVSNDIGNRIEYDARFDINTKKLKLQEDINAKLNDFQTRSDYDKWEGEIDELVTNVTSGMSNKDSPYYCKNNYTAKMFDQVLQEARVQTQQKTTQIVMQYEDSKKYVDFNNGLKQIDDNYSGQAQYAQKAIYLESLKKTTSITPEQEEKYLQEFGQKAQLSAYQTSYDKVAKAGIAAGKTEDEIWADVMKNSETVTRVNSQGVAVAGNFIGGDFKKDCEESIKAQYKADKAQTQRTNQEYFEKDINNLWTKLLKAQNGDTSIDLNQIRTAINAGLNKNNNTATHLLPNGKQANNTDEYGSMINFLNVLEKQESGGKISNKDMAKAFTDKTAKALMTEFVAAYKRGSKSDQGGVASGYEAYTGFRSAVVEEMQGLGYQVNSWEDVIKECPVVTTFFEELEKELPPEAKEIVNATKTATMLIAGKDYADEYLPSVLDLCFDTIIAYDTSDLTPAKTKEISANLIKNVNALYGGALQKNKQWNEAHPDVFGDNYTGLDKVRNFKQTTGKKAEKNLAAAIYERSQNPDIVYTDTDGNVITTGDKKLQAGLTYVEAEEKKEIAKIIKNDTGADVDISQINGEYEADGAYDIKADRVYTYNGYNYRLRSEDGKTLIMEKKKSGATQWEQIKTAKQQADYDNPINTEKRLKKEQKSKIDSAMKNKDVAATVPPLEYYVQDPDGEDRLLTQQVWNTLSDSGREQIITELMENYPEEMNKYLDGLNDKKKKFDPFNRYKK